MIDLCTWDEFNKELIRSTIQEQLEIAIELSGQDGNRHKEAIETLRNQANSFLDGDLIKFNYQFSIGYFGNIESCLRAMVELLEDPNIKLTKAELICQNTFDCLAQKIFLQLDRVGKIIKERKEESGQDFGRDNGRDSDHPMP